MHEISASLKFFKVIPQSVNVNWFLRMSPFSVKTSFSSSSTSWSFGQQTGLDDFIDIGAGQRQPGLESALNLGEIVGLAAVLISPMTASMSSCEVTTIQARPLQTVPRSSVIVWRLSMRCASVPMNWPTSSTRKIRRWSGPLESRYSLTHLQKFSTVRAEAALRHCRSTFRHDSRALAEGLARGPRPPHPG